MPPPVSRIAGLAPPEKLVAEKDAYDKALDAQLAEFQLQAEEQCKMGCFQVDREAQTMVNGLTEAAIIQRTSVDERMALGIAEHKKLFALEQMEKKSYALKKQWYESEAKFTYDYQKVMQAG